MGAAGHHFGQLKGKEARTRIGPSLELPFRQIQGSSDLLVSLLPQSMASMKAMAMVAMVAMVAPALAMVALTMAACPWMVLDLRCRM